MALLESMRRSATRDSNFCCDTSLASGFRLITFFSSSTLPAQTRTGDISTTGEAFRTRGKLTGVRDRTGAHRWRGAGRGRCRSGRRWACGVRGSRRPSSGASPPAARRAARPAGTGDPPPPRPAGPPARGGGARDRTTWTDLPRDPRGAEVAGTLTLGRRRGSRRRGRRRACDVARWIGEGEDGGDERGEEIEYEGSGVGCGVEKVRGGRVY